MTLENQPLPFAAVFLLVLAMLGVNGCDRQGSERSSKDSKLTLVAVSAHAEARSQPDVAILSTGVVSLAQDANSAIRRNSEQMTRIMSAIQGAGVAVKDVQTTGVSLNPDYQYLANRPPRIKGYYASNTVNVTVRDIGSLGGLLDSMVAAGANQINGPTFDIDDKDAVLNEARGQALAKSRTRADGYAKRLGLRVKRVVSIDETGGRAAPRLVSGGSAAVEQAAATNASAPVAPGENVLGLTLDVVYELGK
ncbi:MAG: SIMPL domain-containing protein [Burkholderiales bacterium]|nr:MAG: SIMPL domain-containing protein [Burkholderiales bacterium]